jgi:thiamine monophosphate synthase
MSNTRRSFLQSGAALAAGLASPAAPAAVQVPKIKFFHTEISRMVLGVNPFYGYAHFNGNFSRAMKEFYTQEKVCEVMHQANRYGINAYNYVDRDRARADWARFQSEGGKMHLIIQTTAEENAAALVRDLKPLALQRQGEVVDKCYRAGDLRPIKEWCKQVRDLGVLVGVGTHKPEVIAQIEEEGWDIDFFSGCVYNRTRTPEEWKKILNGEMMELANDIYMQSDPARMYKAIRQTKKPCFAFKILAAGRIPEKGIEQAFRTAFESIKPTDAVYVGIFPRVKDEIRENAEIIHRILARG